MNIREVNERELHELYAENQRLLTENDRLKLQLLMQKQLLEDAMTDEDQASQEPLV